ncbi:MarR family winged helix-turn-helix transcriptional regulator [Paenibacillus arenilitoris]|uniref:MarR family transcriptional regulator n=1 Tax=Paenibacillus arenilitoris TaxID=2772299 RepID=A0A927CKQ8_9BACL|nr:MarR family transcriptional regulator [Paenibacillus arenilitoris]MBD2867671.1 MarR family transcriptional regulator [Paenibacillus arenilitoris]
MELKDTVGYMISSTSRRLNQQLQQLFQDYDVSPEQWSLLISLDEQDGITHKDLAQRTEKDPANLTRLVDQLEGKSLVKRAANPNDRRSQLVCITDQGRKTARTLAPIEAAFVGRLLQGTTDEEIESFKRFMAKINHNAKQQA